MNPNPMSGTADITPEEAAPATVAEAPRAKARKGFACMDPEKVREIARKGGAAAHAAGFAHRFTVEEARAAGKKGGNAPHARRGRKPKVQGHSELVDGGNIAAGIVNGKMGGS